MVAIDHERHLGRRRVLGRECGQVALDVREARVVADASHRLQQRGGGGEEEGGEAEEGGARLHELDVAQHVLGAVARSSTSAAASSAPFRRISSSVSAAGMNFEISVTAAIDILQSEKLTEVSVFEATIASPSDARPERSTS